MKMLTFDMLVENGTVFVYGSRASAFLQKVSRMLKGQSYDIRAEVSIGKV